MGQTQHGINGSKPSAPSVGRYSIYPKSDGYYIQNDQGVENKLALAGVGDSVGKVVAFQFFTSTATFTTEQPSFSTVYSFLTPSLAVGTYVVEWLFTYEPFSTSGNNIFKIAEGATDFPVQVDMASEGKDTGSDIRDPRLICGKLTVSAAGQKTINLRGSQQSGGTTVVKGGFCKITRVL